MSLIDRLNLPEQVRSRLARLELDLASGQRGISARTSLGLVEERIAQRAEIRADEDGAVAVSGYATVWDTPYEVAGGPPWGWTETVAAGSCAKTLRERDDVRFLFDHCGIPMARTRSGTLTLSADDVGLSVDAPSLDVTMPCVLDLRGAMRRGDLDEMSMAFYVLRQEWNGDYTERTITELRLADVSVVTFPANPATVAHLRSLVAALPPAPAGGMPLGLARALADAGR